ncbi:MAG: hypothetical protein CMN77_04210 [Spirochaetaceae bacterium]|nr:hypothetical protein [Spirochaetaceae bacterium]
MPVHQRKPHKNSGIEISRILDHRNQPNRHPSRLPFLALRSFLVFLAIASVNLAGCKSFFRPEIPTGVERRVLTDGSLELVVTGQASKLALAKDSVAMKQTTSREAARLLLEAELQSGNYPGHKERFEIQSVEFLYDFEYCIIKGKYKKK